MHEARSVPRCVPRRGCCTTHPLVQYYKATGVGGAGEALRRSFIAHKSLSQSVSHNTTLQAGKVRGKAAPGMSVSLQQTPRARPPFPSTQPRLHPPPRTSNCLWFVLILFPLVRKKNTTTTQLQYKDKIRVALTPHATALHHNLHETSQIMAYGN